MVRSKLAAIVAALACGALAACTPTPTPTSNASSGGAQVPATRGTNASSPAGPTASHGASGDVKFKNEDGSTFTIADVGGNVKVLNFWGTWCAPCIHEMPLLNDLSKKYASKGVTFVAVSVDEGGPADVKPFLERNAGRVKIDFRVAYAPFEDLAPIDVAAPIPDTLVFDAKGQLVKHFDKIIEVPELEAAIAEALAHGSS